MAKKKAPRPPKDPDDLTPVQRTFVLAFQANGGKAGPAYRACHPNASGPTSWVNGYHMLRNAKVAAVITRDRGKRWEKFEITADEAMRLIATAATANIADAYEDGKLLPFDQWPEHLQLAVKEIKDDGTIKLVDPLKARELIAVDGGRIKRTVDLNLFDHAGYLANVGKKVIGAK